MKNLSILLSSLALVGVLVLLGMKMSEKKPANTAASAEKEKATKTEGRIAYVNIDSLEANYEFLKSKKADFEERKKGMSSELERSQKQFQQDYLSAERKAQAGTMTEAEYETTAKRLQQMKQSLEAREATLTETLLKEQNEFNKDLQERLNKFLKEYNKDKQFDYIFSYSEAVGLIMLTNDELDITKDVTDGLNELYKKEGNKERSGKDTKKKSK